MSCAWKVHNNVPTYSAGAFQWNEIDLNTKIDAKNCENRLDAFIFIIHRRQRHGIESKGDDTRLAMGPESAYDDTFRILMNELARANWDVDEAMTRERWKWVLEKFIATTREFDFLWKFAFRSNLRRDVQRQVSSSTESK